MSEMTLSGESIAAQVVNAMSEKPVAPPAPKPEIELVAPENTGEAQYGFDETFQGKIAALVLRDPAFVARTDGLISPNYFVNSADATLVNISLTYFRKYKRLPDTSTLRVLIQDAIKAKIIRKDMISDIKEAIRRVYTTNIADRDFVIDKIAEFAQYQALERAILKSVDLLSKRKIGEIVKEIQAATMVGASDDLGVYDYWDMVQARTQIRDERAAGIIPPKGVPSGIRALDAALLHSGWGRRELSVIMGGAKMGKSMALGEFSKNASLLGFNVLYITLEVDSEILADRLDANLSGYMMRELVEKSRDVQEQVKRAAAKAGKLLMHRYAPGTLTPADIRRLMERYKAKGIKFDLITVDYADLMIPDWRTNDPIENSKNVWTGLRAIAVEEDLALLTATQTNRDGFKASVAKAEHVADDFNKIRIADIVISINRTEEEKLRNEARLHFAASRNQSDSFSLRINQDLERGRFITRIIGAA